MGSSPLYPGEMIFDDFTDEDNITPPTASRGLEMPVGRGTGYAYGKSADPYPAELLIPESEWEPRIREMEERKTRLSDIAIQAGLPCKDQNGIPYCWTHGPTHATEVIRVVQGQPLVLLSATSVGAVIKNFREQGGWGKEALQFISDRGVMPQSLWPENRLDRKYNTAANWEEARKYVALEWWELKPRNFAQHVSCLLRRIPVAVGLNYWSHEVTDYEPVILDGEVCIRFRNSWGMSWPNAGAMGFSIRRGSKKYADDAVAPRVAVAA